MLYTNSEIRVLKEAMHLNFKQLLKYKVLLSTKSNIMDTKEIEVEVLNDMIQVNNERSKRYDKAIEGLHTEDEDLKTVFAGMSQQSAKYAAVLTQERQALDDDKADEITATGNI